MENERKTIMMLLLLPEAHAKSAPGIKTHAPGNVWSHQVILAGNSG
jgi:hypothetical protein